VGRTVRPKFEWRSRSIWQAVNAACVTEATMPQSLSQRRSWKLFVEGLWGTSAARKHHARYAAKRLTVEAALGVIGTRWPELRSTETSEPVFILASSWRSGSTFLQRLIMSGEEAFVWGEPYRRSALVDSLASQVRAFTDVWPMDTSIVDDHCQGDVFNSTWIANMYPPMADFLAAHVVYFERLFAQPVQASRGRRWGVKEIGLTVDHACYLRWLFPNARFLFLYRNPYDAYRSYRRWRDWYRTWPDKPVFTPGTFGRYWSELTGDFIANHQKVDGLLVQYEELRTPETRKKIELYLGMPLVDPASLPRVDGLRNQNRRKDSRRVPRFEWFLLRRRVEPLASKLGYLGAAGAEPNDSTR
jgi:hypothetical protein